MLWSEFSAIFDNFWQKYWRFSQKPMLWSNFCIIWLCFESKTHFFANFFVANIFKIKTSVPGSWRSETFATTQGLDNLVSISFAAMFTSSFVLQLVSLCFVPCFLSYNDSSRGTRLGEFSPIELLFTLGSLLKLSKERKMGNFFPLYKLCIIFGQKLVRLHFGRFFHKLIWSPW
jgi:hypothetical protein